LGAVVGSPAWIVQRQGGRKIALFVLSKMIHNAAVESQPMKPLIGMVGQKIVIRVAFMNGWVPADLLAVETSGVWLSSENFQKNLDTVLFFDDSTKEEKALFIPFSQILWLKPWGRP